MFCKMLIPVKDLNTDFVLIENRPLFVANYNILRQTTIRITTYEVSIMQFSLRICNKFVREAITV